MNFKSFFKKNVEVQLGVGGNYEQYLENCQVKPKDCPVLFLKYLWQETFGDALQLLESEVLEIVPWILLPTIFFVYFRKSIVETWYSIQKNQIEIKDLTLEFDILNNKLYYYNDDYWDMKKQLKSSTRNLIKLRSRLRSEFRKSRILKIRQEDFECWEDMVKKEFLEAHSQKYHHEVLVMMQEYENDLNITYGYKNVGAQKQDKNKELKRYFKGTAIKSTSLIDNSNLVKMATKSVAKLKINISKINGNRSGINGKLIKLSPYLKQLDSTKYLSKEWSSAFSCYKILPIARSISNIEVTFKGNPLLDQNKIVCIDNGNFNTRNCGDMELKNCLVPIKQKVILLLNNNEYKSKFDKYKLQYPVDQSDSDDNSEDRGISQIKNCSFIEKIQEIVQHPSNKSKRIRQQSLSISSLAEETHCDLANDGIYQEDMVFDN